MISCLILAGEWTPPFCHLRQPPVVGPSSQLLAVVAAVVFAAAPAFVVKGWPSAESMHCEQVVCVPEVMSELHSPWKRKMMIIDCLSWS